jgi:hypothetical protein
MKKQWDIVYKITNFVILIILVLYEFGIMIDDAEIELLLMPLTIEEANCRIIDFIASVT